MEKKKKPHNIHCFKEIQTIVRLLTHDQFDKFLTKDPFSFVYLVDPFIDIGHKTILFYFSLIKSKGIILIVKKYCMQLSLIVKCKQNKSK